jgi:hypothetical protein
VHWLEQRLFEKVYSMRHMSICYLKGQTRLCLAGFIACSCASNI